MTITFDSTGHYSFDEDQLQEVTAPDGAGGYIVTLGPDKNNNSFRQTITLNAGTYTTSPWEKI